MAKRLILASSSTTRRALMQRLGVDFECYSPNIDESQLPAEKPLELVARLAKQKAQAVFVQLKPKTQTAIIASDEVMVNVTRNANEVIGKPLNEARAIQQIKQNAGSLVHFHTSLFVLHTSQSQSHHYATIVTTEVQFKNYSDKLAQEVLQLDKPWQCAGAFRSEGASIRLCEYIKEPEPGTLMGLPLISLSHYLSC